MLQVSVLNIVLQHRDTIDDNFKFVIPDSMFPSFLDKPPSLFMSHVRMGHKLSESTRNRTDACLSIIH